MCVENKIFYTSRDHIKLCGIFTVPRKIKGYTLLAHGLAVDKNEWENFYIDIANELCKRDFASLRFDFRAHGESEGLQKDLTVIGELLDIKATAKKISEQWGGSISIIATSFGAGPSIIYTAQNKDKVKCLVLLCPALDYDATFLNPIVPWVKEFINEESFKHIDEKGYISLDDVFKLGAKLIEEFKIIRPYEFLKEIKCPILTIHGNKDTMAPYEISQKYGVPNDKSKFITIDRADHGFVAFGDETGEHKESKENKNFVINKIIDWIEK